MDPIIADMGVANKAIEEVKIEGSKTIAVAAPSAAPAETPINPGSTRGFLNNPCRQAPDIERAAPTNPASSTLGILISNKTVLSRTFA